ncbi:glycosyltransferase [Kitasatospora sp. NPDC098663]|uniref:glycosyltransferase n=1 Tax=Kitasatospora sp. NPDC098663 TaxID=3364096 RepID=UPI0037FCE01E
MRILIATAGSRGDVAPFTGLGARLQAAGHQVAVATRATFASSVRTAGRNLSSVTCHLSAARPPGHPGGPSTRYSTEADPKPTAQP